jgi:hypothetical protein
VVEFEGDGFLYKMVRLMVGAMVQCALGKRSSGEMGAPPWCHPARGICRARQWPTLVRVIIRTGGGNFAILRGMAKELLVKRLMHLFRPKPLQECA